MANSKRDKKETAAEQEGAEENLAKGISTMIGGMMYMLFLGSQYVTGNIAPYI
eukprot:CAMPEP_0176339102 /NCGR_PEP_ID=MMETSP0126-20121128/492_1 /TAXON_ID=141414 ORGANISM="Strombidinopsis acuminatum, Strain SPMC142" /NCGR_SAMPLE_ID=MMETSP0126 /ASSEMBLY_ACC=CAM_ASM_000229 /LENGTH=52 /DNA_ID=CAMNT_0017682483 /DNA_START=45 /DNA_END=203 /DNA_ORIENTATION=+